MLIGCGIVTASRVRSSRKSLWYAKCHAKTLNSDLNLFRFLHVPTTAPISPSTDLAAIDCTETNELPQVESGTEVKDVEIFLALSEATSGNPILTFFFHQRLTDPLLYVSFLKIEEPQKSNCFY
jgi:hypothetical protein